MIEKKNVKAQKGEIEEARETSMSDVWARYLDEHRSNPPILSEWDEFVTNEWTS